MRVLILADRSFAAHERDMLTRVQVGLIDEGPRVVEALPADLADPDANPLIPTIPYSDRSALLAARARVRRILRALQVIEPPLAPADSPMALLDVIHVFGTQAWNLGVSLGAITGAAVALECHSAEAIRHARGLERAAAAEEAAPPGIWIAPNAPIARALEQSDLAWPVAPAPWGTHTQDRPLRSRAHPAPLSVSIVASGDDPASLAGFLTALAGCPHLPDDALLFADAIAFERHPALWRRARDLRLLERMSLIDRMEARRDLVLQTDILALPDAEGHTRSIILDAMASEMAIIARADPLIEVTAHPGIAVLAQAGGPDAWRDALASLLTEPGARARLGHDAREFVAANRPVHKQIEAILGAYATVRGEGGLKFPNR